MSTVQFQNLMANNQQPCCTCSFKGRCTNCVCIRQGRNCAGCKPSQLNICSNLDHQPSVTPNSTIPSNNDNVDDRDRDQIDDPLVLKLPPYDTISQANYKWANLNKHDFELVINTAYNEVIKWKPNILVLPRGNLGKEFVKEIGRLFEGFANASAIEGIALKAVIVFQLIMLQKSHSRSDNDSNKRCLTRRLQLWSQGKIYEILNEGRTIQKYLSTKKNVRRCNDDPSIFSNLVHKGKIKQAARLVSKTEQTGILDLNASLHGKTVLEILKEKHPAGKPISEEALVEVSHPEETNPVIFEKITASLIKRIVLNMKGSGGPSGIDANGWQRYCTMYNDESTNLCEAVAATARRIAITPLDPQCLSALIAGRLIPLDKKPGVRPIGIGETVRRIICKAILFVLKPIIGATVGVTQLCAGMESGCEAAVKAMRTSFESEDTEAVMFVDATNAFNSLNRKGMLHNVQSVCPPLATTTINLYRNKSSLYVKNEVIESTEGTTQGDPLAMPLYAISTLPLIRSLPTEITQIWYADDAGAGGKLCNLKDWWDSLSQKGPGYGYFPNSKKTWLVVKDIHYDQAKIVFKDTHINITTDGRPYLGSAIGKEHFVNDHIKNKIAEWDNELEMLTTYAKPCPQAAYTVLLHSLFNEWNYLMRTTNCSVDDFNSLEDRLREDVIPALTGQVPLNDIERDILALPTRCGGLGITNPTTLINNYEKSSRITEPLVSALLKGEGDFEEMGLKTRKIKNLISKEKADVLEERLELLHSQLTSNQTLMLKLAAEKGASSWLTTIPIASQGFSLQKNAFRDGLCLRYGWRPLNLPSRCACGAENSVQHALSCSTGGFTIIRHNEIRDNLATLLKEVCHNVAIEPMLQPITGEHLQRSTISEANARLDVAVSGFTGDRFERTFYDVRVFNPLVRSNHATSIESVYSKHEQEKRRRYEERVREVENSNFSPFVMSCTGGYGQAAALTIKRLASLLAEKRQTPYSTMIAWLRTQFCFSMLRSCIMSLRGARKLREHTTINSDQSEVAMSQGRF